MNINREMLAFLRKQYPAGTRIRLDAMQDPYAPVEAGTTGKLNYIDDAGQFHMKWDNGRTLALIPGVDSFTVLPPELSMTKLYMPLTAELYEPDVYGNMQDEPELLTGRDLTAYEDHIRSALVKYRMPEEVNRGIMHWYDAADSVNDKVRSVTFDVERRDGKLWGKLNVDKLLLRQKQGFYCASPVGYNALGREFERVLPAGSVANLYPFNYSGKTDPNGFYIGKDKYGSNIVVDFDRRDSDKTSANILILGNSGQGKSYLMKLLICNLLEAGKSVISLDAEHELEELCGNLNGCFVDLMAGEKRINVLEVRYWNEDTEADESAPEAFRKSTLLARHISFLKDFFRAYKDFSDPQLDTIEIMLSALYKKWDISEETDFRRLTPEDYPILSDLYALINDELVNYRNGSLYTRELLQEVLLGMHSLCVGADAPFFNGHTNISDDRFLVFGVGGVLTAAKSLRNALLFNVLAYMSDRLLTAGNTVAALDELYLWLSNPVSIEYIRNCLKRVRKRDSALIMASQNLEDFDQEGVREMTKPLFAIPPHQFLFNPGSIGKRFYMDIRTRASATQMLPSQMMETAP